MYICLYFLVVNNKTSLNNNNCFDDSNTQQNFGDDSFSIDLHTLDFKPLASLVFPTASNLLLLLLLRHMLHTT